MEKETIKVLLNYWEKYKNQDDIYSSDDYSFKDFMDFLETEIKYK